MSSVLSMQKNFVVLTVLLISNCFSNAHNETGKILSRKKRHLLFPEGSSLQLVYDFTVPISYSQTIFVFSTTAALAWMLPSTIEDFKNGFFSKKFFKVPISNSRIDTQKTKLIKTKPIYNTEFGHSKPYEKYTTEFNDKRKPDYWNQFIRYKPHFLQFPNDENYYNNNYRPLKYQNSMLKSPAYLQSMRRKYYTFNNRNVNGFYKNKVEGVQNYQPPVRTYVNPIYNHYHRRTGRDLFKKIEKFLAAQKKDGRSCVLKAICEVNEEFAHKKGTFTEEILKAIFRFRPSHDGESDVYDDATRKVPSCAELYPCDFSIWEVI